MKRATGFSIDRGWRALSGVVFACAVSAGPSLASWSENGHTIRSIDELLPTLSSSLATPVGIAVPNNYPVLTESDVIDAQSVVVDLLLSGLRIESRGSTSTVKALHSTSEAQRATTRLLASTPTAPSLQDPDAIAFGRVALFGRVIAPPFRVEVVTGHIRVNGVDVFPSPGDATSSPTPKREQVEAHDRESVAVAAFQNLRGTASEATARENLRREAASRSGVTSAAWRDDDQLVMQLADGGTEILSFVQGRENDEDHGAATQSMLETQADLFRETLRANSSLLFGATYCVPVTDIDAADFAARVNQIRSSSESEALRIARMQAYTHDRNAAADLLYAR